jgi:hypothetical protein
VISSLVRIAIAPEGKKAIPETLNFVPVISIPLRSGSSRLRRLATGRVQVYDPIRKRWVAYTPEEAVRQNFIAYCLTELKYPPAYIAVEKSVAAPGIAARADLLVYNASHQAWMLVECKAPEVAVSEQTLYQLLRYQHALGCRYWVLYNGIECFCADAQDLPDIRWLPALPPFEDLIG